MSAAVLPVAPANEAEASCLGLCQIHANSLWGRGDVQHAAACQQVCTPYAAPQWTGAGHLGWFKSEFGCNAWASFESMTSNASGLPPSQWGE